MITKCAKTIFSLSTLPSFFLPLFAVSFSETKFFFLSLTWNYECTCAEHNRIHLRKKRTSETKNQEKDLLSIFQRFNRRSDNSNNSVLSIHILHLYKYILFLRIFQRHICVNKNFCRKISDCTKYKKEIQFLGKT